MCTRLNAQQLLFARGSLRSVRNEDVSYDLAVWEGPTPTSAEALETFESMYNTYMESSVPVEATPAIHHYVEALLQRWPDLTETERTVWADGPLIGNASGPMIYFAMVWSHHKEASAFAVHLAARHGLVCFDPQREALRTT